MVKEYKIYLLSGLDSKELNNNYSHYFGDYIKFYEYDYKKLYKILISGIEKTDEHNGKEVVCNFILEFKDELLEKFTKVNNKTEEDFGKLIGSNFVNIYRYKHKEEEKEKDVNNQHKDQYIDLYIIMICATCKDKNCDKIKLNNFLVCGLDVDSKIIETQLRAQDAIIDREIEIIDILRDDNENHIIG